MRKPLWIALLLCLALPQPALAQCDYTKLMAEGRRYLQQKPPAYREALRNFNAARTCKPDQSAEVDVALEQLFAMIEAERDDAIRLREKTSEALALAEAEKKNALAAKQTAEQKANAVLDKIYFYRDRFGLVYDKNARCYGFVDKNLTTKIAFQYYEALPFEGTGFAKVKGLYNYFLIDTLGQEYRLATELSQLSPEITALDLREKKLKEIPDTVWKSVPLKVLRLAGNKLQSLPTQIGELKSLQSLNLSFNHLQSLPEEIGELKNLRSLYLGDNQLQNLPGAIGELKSLQSLNLRYNKLQSLPGEIGELKSLQSLDLSNNQLQNLPGEIGKLKNLRSLNVSQNSLQMLPREIVELESLQSLNLSRNGLESLPKEIIELKNLQSLYLSGNDLKMLPREIVELKNLQSLYLGNNKLHSLPEEIVEMESLQSLVLFANGLQSLPKEIIELKSLQSLDLNTNQLQSLSGEIAKLKNLQSLNLNHNPLQSLPEEIGELKNLRSLYLGGNQLQSLPEEIGKLNNLQSLDLSDNQLQSLPKEIGELNNLQSLDLRSNHLQSLPEAIGKLNNLQSLYLSGNNLKTLPIAVLGQMPNLKKVILANAYGTNPLPDATVAALRAAMPWCEVEWNPKAFFERNQASRKQAEATTIADEAHLKSNPNDENFQQRLADTYCWLGWCQMLTNQFSEAETAIRRGLALDATNVCLPVRLAPALLLQGKTAEAIQVYKKWKDRPFGKWGLPFYKDAFLQGLAALESAGSIPEARAADVAAVRKLLGE